MRHRRTPPHPPTLRFADPAASRRRRRPALPAAESERDHLRRFERLAPCERSLCAAFSDAFFFEPLPTLELRLVALFAD